MKQLKFKYRLFYWFYAATLVCFCGMLTVTQCLVAPVEVCAAKKKKSRKNNRKAKPKSTTKPIEANSHTFTIDSILADGIIYKQLLVKMNGLKHNVNIIQVDLNNPKAEVQVIKGGNNIMELERLPEMLDNTKVNTERFEYIAGINANFWRALTNYPIGPTIIDGEIAELRSYKKWTSTFFNEDGRPFIDFFTIQGEIVTKNGSYRIPINSANRRTDSNGVVMYNQFGGDVIPYINSKKVQDLMLQGMDNMFQDGEIVDSTESVNSLEMQKGYLLEAERSSNLEYDFPKLIVKYIDQPAVNTFVRCIVVDSVGGSVQTSSAGCVLSIGKNINPYIVPQVGDIINLHFWTNVSENQVFTNSICATPRLVRDGFASHEAYEEGSNSKRFINGALPRSAIGYNRDKSKLFLVAVPGSNKKEGTSGASLAQLADIMEYIGCYSAHNLDGGGSTNMVIKGNNIINHGSSRKLSVAVAATKLKQAKPKSKLPQRNR